MLEGEKRSWKFITLFLAALYNILWGSWVVLFPKHSFEIFGMIPPERIEIWQCVGMIVGVYGIGYYIAAYNPNRHWPIVLVGLLGKIFGPIGFLDSLLRGVFPLEFGINIIFNDLIWWIPFSLILYEALRRKNLKTQKVFKLEDIESLEPRKRAKLINSLPGFKPCNLIGTVNNEGQTNLSIVSSVTHLGSAPALVSVIFRPDSSPRHTLENIRANKLFTINHVHKGIVKQAHQTSARYQREESEFLECGLTEEFRDSFAAPFVKESYLKFSVEMIREIKIKENGTHFVIGKIKQIYLPDSSVGDDGHIDLSSMETICTSGLDSYHITEAIGRLQYAKPHKTSHWI